MTGKTTLYFTKGTERVVRSTEDLNETNDLTIGQVFLAVAKHYNKSAEDYPRWISFSKNRSEFDVIKERMDECINDVEKIQMACDWLGEEIIS